MTEPRDPPAAGRSSRVTGAAVLGALLVALGILWLLAALDVTVVSVHVAVGALLVLVGLGLALLPPGAHHGLLVAAGVVLAFVAAAVSALNLHLVDTTVGERRETPTALTDVQHRYSLGVGSLGIDLTQLEVDEEPAGAVPVTATIGIGELVVAVPGDAALVVDAHVGMGEIDVRGQRRSGVDVRLRTEDDEAADPDGIAFRLQLEGGVGSIRVVDDDLGDLGERR